MPNSSHVLALISRNRISLPRIDSFQGRDNSPSDTSPRTTAIMASISPYGSTFQALATRFKQHDDETTARLSSQTIVRPSSSDTSSSSSSPTSSKPTIEDCLFDVSADNSQHPGVLSDRYLRSRKRRSAADCHTSPMRLPYLPVRLVDCLGSQGPTNHNRSITPSRIDTVTTSALTSTSLLTRFLLNQPASEIVQYNTHCCAHQRRHTAPLTANPRCHRL